MAEQSQNCILQESVPLCIQLVVNLEKPIKIIEKLNYVKM